MSARTAEPANGTARRRFSVRVSRSGETAVLYCSGRIRFKDDAARFSHALVEQMNCGRHVFLEFSALNSLNSEAMRELAFAYMHAKGRRCSIGLVAPTGTILSLFEPTNFMFLFEIYPTLKVALDSSSKLV